MHLVCFGLRIEVCLPLLVSFLSFEPYVNLFHYPNNRALRRHIHSIPPQWEKN
jgi:hypothetical protein